MADIDLGFVLLELDCFVCAALAFIMTALAYSRYRKKNSQLTKTIFYMFISIGLLNLWAPIRFLLSKPGMEQSPESLTLAILMSFAVYFVFDFSRIVFAGEHSKLDTIIKAMFVIDICLCIIATIYPTYVLAFSFLWKEVFAFSSVIPIISGGIKLKRRIPKDDPHYSHLSSIVQMAVFFLINDIVFLIDGLINTISGVFPNAVSFLPWIFLDLALYSAYRGFFSKAKGI